MVGQVKTVKGQMGCNAVRNVFVLPIPYIEIEKSGCIRKCCEGCQYLDKWHAILS